MMTTVLAAMQSAFWHVPMSVMPVTWESISMCGERGRSGRSERWGEPANAYSSVPQDHSVPAYVPRRVQQDCMVREEEGELEVCGERRGEGEGERGGTCLTSGFGLR